MARRARFGAVSCVVLTAALVAAACTGPAATTGSTSGGAAKGAINIYLYQEPKGNFGPLAPASGPDNQVRSLIGESLLAVDPDYKLQPQLAQSYDISPDAKTFTFHLRTGLKWSDGTPFTAQDVLFTYQLLANPKTGSANTANFAGLQFSAPDDNTFVIASPEPDYGLLTRVAVSYTTSTMIVPKHILGSVAVDQMVDNTYFKNPTVTLGPYKFVEYKPNQYVHLTANPNYRTPVKVKDIYLKPMASDVATAQLGNGGIDIASFSPADLSTVQGFKDVGVQQGPGAGFIRIAWNQSRPYFQDVRVRQAFLYAIDRAQLVDKVLYGKAAVQNADFYYKDAPSGLNDYAYNPDKAKSLLQQAGWDFGRTVTLQWVPGQRDRDAAATIVQSQLQAVGVKVNLKHVQAADNTASFDHKSFDMLLYGGGDYALDPSKVNVIVACSQIYPNGGNISWFCDKQLDSLMQQANSTTDAAKRKQLYDQAVIEENGQADLLWLYDPMGLWGVNRRVQGFKAPGSQEAPFWNPASWSVAS